MKELRQSHPSFWEENRSLATGVILASAVAAGVMAYMLRKAREAEPVEVPAGIAERAWERARDAAGGERVEAARDFVTERVLPELKPALLAVLHDLEEVVNDYFRRTEKSITQI